MKKALRIIAITAGVISAVSALILGCLYLEDIAASLKKFKSKISSKLQRRGYLDTDYDFE